MQVSDLHPAFSGAFVAAPRVVYCALNVSCPHLFLTASQLRSERVYSSSLCSKRSFFGPCKATYLGRGLSQAHEGLPFRGGRHCGQLQTVRLQLRDRSEESGSWQRCGGEVCSGPVVFLVSTEVEGHLFADGGRPRPPLVLHRYRDKHMDTGLGSQAR